MGDQKIVAVERILLRMNISCHGVAMSEASKSGVGTRGGSRGKCLHKRVLLFL